MQSMQEHAHIGLRERKKTATRLAIERAAVRIAYEQGYEAATAQAIAAEADVSLRTFFNYFPSKDVAVVGTGLNLIDEQKAQQILEESDPDLLGGINRVAEACMAETGYSAEFMLRRRRLLQEYPQLSRPNAESIERFETWLATVVAEHLHAHPSHRYLDNRLTVEEEALLAVNIVAAAVRYHWHLSLDKDLDETTAARDIKQVIDMMAVIHEKTARVRCTATRAAEPAENE